MFTGYWMPRSHLIESLQYFGAEGDCGAHQGDEPEVQHHTRGLDPLEPLVLDQECCQQLQGKKDTQTHKLTSTMTTQDLSLESMFQNMLYHVLN